MFTEKILRQQFHYFEILKYEKTMNKRIKEIDEIY